MLATDYYISSPAENDGRWVIRCQVKDPNNCDKMGMPKHVSNTPIEWYNERASAYERLYVLRNTFVTDSNEFDEVHLHSDSSGEYYHASEEGDGGWVTEYIIRRWNGGDDVEFITDYHKCADIDTHILDGLTLALHYAHCRGLTTYGG